MGWLYLLAALVFPPVFILWRPRTPVPSARMKVRLAAAVVVVWMLMILWSVQGSFGQGTAGLTAEQSAVERPEAGEQWETDASSDAPLIVALGWVPGLVYAGLLMLARKGLEPQAVEVLDAPAGPARRRKRFSE